MTATFRPHAFTPATETLSLPIPATSFSDLIQMEPALEDLDDLLDDIPDNRMLHAYSPFRNTVDNLIGWHRGGQAPTHRWNGGAMTLAQLGHTDIQHPKAPALNDVETYLRTSHAHDLVWDHFLRRFKMR